MIRIEEHDGWTLIGHRDHARLAGAFATRWGNAEFATPKPHTEVLQAVNRHDDAWAERDRVPKLTREGRPSAYPRELVGAYSAFEEIDLADYLAVRGRATEVIAADNPYAAALVSMHTVNLLTEHADLSTFSPEGRALHARFVERQLVRQKELCHLAGVDPASLRRPFEFLQGCDSLSLTACVRYASPIAVRHAQLKNDGTSAVITITPKGHDTYQLSPYPFDADKVSFDIPCKRIKGVLFPSEERFQSLYELTPTEYFTVRFVR